MPGIWEVVLAYALLLITAGLSYWKKLHIERDFLWAGARMGVQIMLLGVILQWIIRHPHPVIIICAGVLMTFNAGLHSTSRVRLRYPGLILQNLLTTFLAVWPVCFVGLWLLTPHDKLNPSLVLPLLGMILGNALNGITLGLDHYTDALKDKRDWIMCQIALGATPSEATHALTRKALRHAATPVLNSMMATGIISIPGMMTGQLLAGVDPLKAATYQVVMMILISCGGFLGGLIGIKLCERKHFDDRGALC